MQVGATLAASRARTVYPYQEDWYHPYKWSNRGPEQEQRVYGAGWADKLYGLFKKPRIEDHWDMSTVKIGPSAKSTGWTAEDYYRNVMKVGAHGVPKKDAAVDDALKAVDSLWGDMFLPDPAVEAELDYLNRIKALQDQEFALREAMLNGDIDKARQLLKDIEANRKALQEAYERFRGFVNPYFDAEMAAAEKMGAETAAKLDAVQAATAEGLAAASEGAAGSVAEFGELIGNTAAGVEAAQGIAGNALAEFSAYVTNSQLSDEKIAKAAERAAVIGADGDRAFVLHEVANRERLAMAGFDEMADEAADTLAELEMRKKLFDLERKRADLEHQRAVEAAYGSAVPMDAITYGRAAAEQYFAIRADAAGIKADRQQQLLQAWTTLFEQGAFSRADAEKLLNGNVGSAEKPRKFADELGLSQAERQIILGMFDAYSKARDKWQSGQAQPPAFAGYVNVGNIPVSKSGVPQNNRQVGAAAKNPSSGAFYARQKWVTAMIPQWSKMFGIKRIGQWRSTSAQVTAGRSANSDHYTGGALDFHGTPAQMAEVARYFKNHPAVAYVMYGDAHHKDHVHVSFKINYNYGG